MTRLFRPLPLLAVAIALSIGWGIRGNYGHETGAMFPGALAALAACLVSGRRDWLDRYPYFGLWGMLGWAFGGSISYMILIGYTHSGHSSTQLYGYASLFLVGFLWAAFGGGATAIPASVDERQLRDFTTALIPPIIGWFILYWGLDPFSAMVQSWVESDGMPSPDHRQELALYWLDSDWVEVTTVLGCIVVAAVIRNGWQRAYRLPLYMAVSAAGVFLIGWAIALTMGFESIYATLVQHQGLYEDRFRPDELAVTNWPPLFLHFADSQQWFYSADRLFLLAGAALGLLLYFVVEYKPNDALKLFFYMAVGWFVGFLLLPVIGSLFLANWGGLRMTPPRGDNWAGILGVYVAAVIYLMRTHFKAIVMASLVCGAIGGIGFSGAAFLESSLESLGNPNASLEPAFQAEWTAWQETLWQPDHWNGGQKMQVPHFASPSDEHATWTAWHRQNWHSVLEQSYGFINGIGVAIALGMLATRVPERYDLNDRLGWQHLFCFFMFLPILIAVNMIKNLRAWTDSGSMPDKMAVPFIEYELSLTTWFYLCLAAMLLGLGALAWIHAKWRIRFFAVEKMIAGQRCLLILLWMFIVGNFARALPGFNAGRLITEGTVYLNAILLSVLVLALAADNWTIPAEEQRKPIRVATAFAFLVACAVCVPWAQWKATRSIYGDAHTGKRGINIRWGPNADWKRAPLLKGNPHR